MTRLPDFVVAGASKCGTTSLHDYLRQHPEVYLPEQKELNYFSYDVLARHAAGPGDAASLAHACATRADYERHYRGSRDEPAAGDVSPSYFHFSVVAVSLKKELGDARVVISLRDPVEKSFSQYMHLVRDNREPLSFREGLEAEPRRIEEGWIGLWHYTEACLYAPRLRDFFSAFGRERVRVIVFEELRRDPLREVQELFRFLGVDPGFEPDVRRAANRSGRPRSKLLADFIGKPNLLKRAAQAVVPRRARSWVRSRLLAANTGAKDELDDASRALLVERFRPDVEEVEELLGRRLPWSVTGGGRT